MTTAQLYHFDANNVFLVGSVGYDTLMGIMPNLELSPMRIEYQKKGGFLLSFSQSYVQDRAEHLNYHLKKSFSSVQVEISQVPQIELRQGANRMYAHCILQTSIAGVKYTASIPATLSFIPNFVQQTGELVASDMQVEKPENGILPPEYVDPCIGAINVLLPEVFANYVLYTVPKSQLFAAKFFGVRDARVVEGRLELSIF